MDNQYLQVDGAAPACSVTWDGDTSIAGDNNPISLLVGNSSNAQVKVGGVQNGNVTSVDLWVQGGNVTALPASFGPSAPSNTLPH